MRPEELKPGKSWRGSLICLTPQPDKYLYGQKQSGWMEVGLLCKTIVLMPDASWQPTEDQSHFRYFFLGLWSHIASFACCSNLNLSWSDLGVEDAASGGVYKQDQPEHQNMQHLHSPFYRPQWFTVIDVHIPERFKGNQWLRLWFHLRLFPDKWLNCAWSCQNTTGEHRSVLAHECAQGLGKDTSVRPSPRCCRGLSVSSTSPLGGPGRLSSKDSSVSVLFQGISAQPRWESVVFSVWQHL